MDFSGKSFELAALIPYFVLVLEVIGLDNFYLTLLSTAVVILIAKLAFKKLICGLEEEQQPKRYALFFMFPVLMLFGSWYV